MVSFDASVRLMTARSQRTFIFLSRSKMTASPSLITSSFASFWKDCTSTSDRNWNSPSLFASTRRELCQFPGMTAVLTTRLRVRTPFPRFFLVAVFKQSYSWLSHTRSRRDTPGSCHTTCCIGWRLGGHILQIFLQSQVTTFAHWLPRRGNRSNSRCIRLSPSNAFKAHH